MEYAPGYQNPRADELATVLETSVLFSLLGSWETRPAGELVYLLLYALEGWDWKISILGFPVDSNGDDQLGWVGQLSRGR